MRYGWRNVLKSILKQNRGDIKKGQEHPKTLQDNCSDVSNIAKSIVFEGQDVAIIVITSGSNRVDRKKKLKKILGYKPGQASPEYVLESTGYAVGGVPPFGHLKETIKIIDEDLFKYDLIWGAGGTVDTVFPITPEDLKEICKAEIRDVKQ